jgi:kynurenine 3-monooxygenase
MTEPAATRFTVLGAGLAGALMAIYLGRRGYRVTVFDMRPDPRRDALAGGRSINLAISARGLHALSQVGLTQRVLDMAVPMRGRMMHDEYGHLTYQSYGVHESQVINSVSRNGLNVLLIEAAAEHSNVQLLFGQKCTDVDIETGHVTLLDTGTGQNTTVDGGVVVAADGAYSVGRRQMYRLDRFDYAQSYLEHGYKELTIPSGKGGEFQMEPNALHIWPRGGYMMIALPNYDGSFTCTLFWPYEGPNSFAAIKTRAHVTQFFEATFPDAIPLMPTLQDDYVENPTSSLVTVRCRPWHHRDRIVLLGDACHAVVPFYGQGANAAFEDCVVLDRCLGQNAPDWERVFVEYELARKAHTDVLAELAIENFREMRDKVASRTFLAKKRLEKFLHRFFPRWFIPLYSMVTFGLTPYGEAVERDRKQWAVVKMAAVITVAFLVAVMWITLMT